MRYKHDCDACKTLGQYKEFDLYVCHNGPGPTVIARRSDEPGDYHSGLVFARVNPALAEAQQRAVRMGYLTTKELT